MYKVGVSYLNDTQEAEDVVQTCMIKFTKNYVDQFDDIESNRIRALLFTIAKNASIDLLRKKERLNFKGFVDDAIDESDPLTEILSIDDFHKANKILSQINESYADMISLRYYHELTVPEIADLLCISENNVSVRINRAKKALKKVLAKEVS